MMDGTPSMFLLLAMAAVATDVLVVCPPWLRWTALSLLLSVAVIGLVGRLVVPIARFRARQALRELEDSRRELGQMLRTSAQVAQDRERVHTGFSPALVEALARQADDELQNIDSRRLIPWRKVACGVVVMLLLVSAFVVAVVLWPDFRTGTQRLLLPAAELSFTRVTAFANCEQFERGETIDIAAATTGRPTQTATVNVRDVAESEGQLTAWERIEMTALDATRFSAAIGGRERSFEFYVRAGDGRTRIQFTRFIDPPVIQSLAVRLVYPPYTGLEPQDTADDAIVAVEGTRVELEFLLNHGLTEARLWVNDVALSAVELRESSVFGAFTLEARTYDFFLEGLDAEGLPLKQKIVYHAEGFEDKVPQVAILQPREDVEATKLTEVPVRVQFRDDFGLAEVGVVLHADGQEQAVFARTYGDEAVFRLHQRLAVLLEQFPLTIQSNVRIYAYARDRKPGAERRGVSDLRAVDIIPLKRWFQWADSESGDALSAEQMQEQQQNLEMLENAIDAQRDALSQTFKLHEERSTNATALEQLAAIETRLAEQLEQLQESVNDIAAPTEENLLRQAAERMQQAAEQLRREETAPALANEDAALSDMLKTRQEMIEQLQQQQQKEASAASRQQQRAQEQTSLAQLAEEAERLAREEDAVREQLVAATERTPSPQEQTQPEPEAAAENAEEQAAAQSETDAAAQASAEQQTPARSAQQKPDASAQEQTPAQTQAQEAAAEQAAQQAPSPAEAQGQPEASSASAAAAAETAETAPDSAQQQERSPQDAAAEAQQPEQAAAAEPAEAQEQQQQAAAAAPSGPESEATAQPQESQASAAAAETPDATQPAPADPTPSPEQRQSEAVADAGELLESMQAHPERTPLALQRMTQAEQTMREAQAQMQQDETTPASASLSEAEQRLRQLAEHLRGLDSDNLSETLEQAASKAQQAAEQLSQAAQSTPQQQKPAAAEPQSAQNPSAEKQSQQQSPAKPTESQQQQALASAQTPAQAASQSSEQSPEDRQDSPRSSAEQKAQQESPELADDSQRRESLQDAREASAQDAETVADWLDRVQEHKLEGLEKMQERLAQAQQDTGLAELADTVRAAQQQRERGEERQADAADRDAAERFSKLAEALDKERKRLVQGHLERLAAAEAQAKDLQSQLAAEARQPADAEADAEAQNEVQVKAEGGAGQGGEETTEERLEDLGEELKDLKDAELEEIGDRLLEQIGPQNVSGAKPLGGRVVPETVSETTLKPAVRRLQELIEEIVQREMLLHRDDRVPDKYARLVEKYFKTLSDDLRE